MASSAAESVDFMGDCRRCGHRILFRPDWSPHWESVHEARVFCSQCRATNTVPRCSEHKVVADA